MAANVINGENNNDMMRRAVMRLVCKRRQMIKYEERGRGRHQHGLVSDDGMVMTAT
jgi:hypothetical protein